ncbi:MAG: proline--tRNA ligase [Sphaerochaetaceae bacterium]|nr:proline--tRNA ligase [Sphaerochaetaceae bacterium]
MRMSKMFSKTLREAPSAADSKGYEMLLRAGFIRQMGAGIFTLLPLGYRTNSKIENIIREEMDQIGGQEILMPVVNPADIWKETGRYYSIDKEMSRFNDRANRDMVLAMTHEEDATAIARNEIGSYKKLPQLVYQIQTKWRDDARPRAGLIRVREFTMKDSYSFDRTVEGLNEQYKNHYASYFRIFSKAGLPVIVVGADSGMMGGKVSHEYMYLSPIGEDTIITCDKCGYTSNRQVAVFQKKYFKEEEKPIEKIKTPDCKTIEELCTFLNVEKRQTAKAVFMVGTFIDNKTGEEEEKLITAIIRGDLDVEENKLQKVAKANSLRPAHEEEILAANMVPGYGSAINCDPKTIVIVDDSVKKSNNLVAGANEKGYHLLNTNFGRDYTGKVADIASAKDGYTCQCGHTLKENRGIEVGNIFQLGTRYSEAMNCYFTDEDGKNKPVIMGSYGIGVGRFLACLAEEYTDEKGLSLPISVAPYQVHLINLIKDKALSEKIYEDLSNAGVEVLFDDRKESPGVKFTDADLIGIPIRITLGNRSVKEGKAEVKFRKNLDNNQLFDLDTLTSKILESIKTLKQELEQGIVNKELEI